MNRAPLLQQLEQALVVQPERPPLPRGNLGLVLVDAVQGFTRRGNLSDPRSMAPMVHQVNQLVRQLQQRLGPRLHLLVLRDCHAGDIPEPPYPPHCIAGSGEDQLDPELAWLEHAAQVTLLDKDCINGFVGAMQPAGGAPGERLWRNRLADWVVRRELNALLVVGDCTDICVSDLTVALLSARNHGMLTAVAPERREAYVEAITSMPILVHAGACATFDLDPDEPLPDAQRGLRHPGVLAHHVGLWLMASRGAQIIDGFAELSAANEPQAAPAGLRPGAKSD